jgi:hypothetical protein
MKHRLLSWNVRGLNEGPRVWNLLREWKVDIVCFQETKLEVMCCSVVRSLWGCHHVDWCCLDSRGALGGILITWNRRVVEKIDECVGEFSLAISFRNIEDYSTWAFAGAYGPNADDIEGLCGMSWLVCSVGGACLGVLGMILTSPVSLVKGWEKLACAQRWWCNFIFEQGLMDLPVVGDSFTWLNNRDSPARS